MACVAGEKLRGRGVIATRGGSASNEADRDDGGRLDKRGPEIEEQKGQRGRVCGALHLRQEGSHVHDDMQAEILARVGRVAKHAEAVQEIVFVMLYVLLLNFTSVSYELPNAHVTDVVNPL